MKAAKKSPVKKLPGLPPARVLPDIEENGAVFVLNRKDEVRVIDIFGKALDEEPTEGAALDNVDMKKLEEALKIVQAAVWNKKVKSKLPETKALYEVGRSLHAQKMNLHVTQ